jgi:hypothetical protein
MEFYFVADCTGTIRELKTINYNIVRTYFVKAFAVLKISSTKPGVK